MELRNLSIEYFRSANRNNKEEYEKGLEFLSKHLGNIGEKEGASILSALEAERMRMFMYTSCGWFFNDISGVETKQVVSSPKWPPNSPAVCRPGHHLRPLINLEKAKGQ